MVRWSVFEARDSPPLLYDLGADPGEEHNVAEGHPDVLAETAKIVRGHTRATVPDDRS